MKRLVTTLAVLALAFTTLLVGPGAQASTSPTASVSHVSAPAAAAKHRTVGFRFVNTSGDYKFVGKVSPKGGKRVAVLQKLQSGNWKQFKKTKTKANGTYAFTKLARVGKFRVFIRASAGYAGSFSDVIKVVRR